MAFKKTMQTPGTAEWAEYKKWLRIRYQTGKFLT